MGCNESCDLIKRAKIHVFYEFPRVWFLKVAKLEKNIDFSRCFRISSLSDEFVIDNSYVENLQRKRRIFRDQTETKKTLFTTLVTTFGVKKNAYFLASRDNQLTMDDLF